LVHPWKRTNAKRSAQRKDYPPRRSNLNMQGQDHGRLAGAGGHDRGSGVMTEISDQPPA
jgi:hypothetical protein